MVHELYANALTFVMLKFGLTCVAKVKLVGNSTHFLGIFKADSIGALCGELN
jgi:hypothetical protein